MPREPYLVADSVPAEPGTRCRFTLRRRWSEGGYTAVIVGLNPSTAAGDTDDMTIRKEVGFCKRNHLSGFTKVNLFATRATNPLHLLAMRESVGTFDANLFAIQNALAQPGVSHVICAWGGASGRLRQLVDKRVTDLVNAGAFNGRMLWSFGTTKDGYPCHTSRLPYDTMLTPWQFVSRPEQFPRPYAEAVSL
ncbi:MAG TPA: DUF1643 domain-containing protein [Polyangia bacterium]